MKNLERENKLLRSLVADLSSLVKDLFEVMPPEIRELPQSQQAIDISKKLMSKYIEYASQVQTPRDC